MIYSNQADGLVCVIMFFCLFCHYFISEGLQKSPAVKKKKKKVAAVESMTIDKLSFVFQGHWPHPLCFRYNWTVPGFQWTPPETSSSSQIVWMMPHCFSHSPTVVSISLQLKLREIQYDLGKHQTNQWDKKAAMGGVYSCRPMRIYTQVRPLAPSGNLWRSYSLVPLVLR